MDNQLNAKEIGRKAGRIFQYYLPDHWTFRSQEDQEDYGIDGEIELINSDKPTGFIFKTQIKGQKSVSVIENSTKVSFSLKASRLKYYMQEVEIPIILVVVDVTTEKVYWKSLQDDAQIREDLAQALDKKQNTVTIHIPVIDSLPDQHEKLLFAVESNINWLKFNALSKMTIPIETMIRKSHDDLIATMLEKSKILNFHLFSESFERLYANGRFDELFDKASAVLNSATEKVETRFCAGLYIERTYLQKVADPTSEECDFLCFNLYLILLDLIRENKVVEYIRLYVVLLLRSILLKLTVDADYHFYLSTQISDKDDLTKWIVNYSRSQVVLKAARNVKKVIHLINRIILSGNKYLLLETFPRVGYKIAIFAHRLSLDDQDKQSNDLYSWIKYCINLSLDFAKELDHEGFIAQILVLNSTFKINTKDAETYLDESFEICQSIKDESIRINVSDTIAKIKTDLKRNNEDVTPEEELKFFRKRAKALGFDYADPKDEMGRIINQGLKDYNPERILKDCENLLVFPSRAQGIPARVVGLPSASMKWIHCTKKGYAMGGWDLDSIYRSPIKELGFENQYCKNCEHKTPRDDSWKWTSKWQNEENQKYKEVIIKIDSI